MIRRPFLVFAVLVLTALPGCKRAAPENASPAAAPADPAFAGRIIEITAGDTMKFSPNVLSAAPGEALRVILINNGRQPKAAMGHNWVLLKKGADTQAFVNAAVSAADHDYLPPARAADVLAHTALIGPRERAIVDFQAPTEPGNYVFLCSFPAHYQLAMKGILTVR